MKITSKGQVTIPQKIRKQFGFLPHTEVKFVVAENEVKLKKEKGNGARGKTIIDQMKGKGTVTMSTDEIMALTRDDNS